MITTVGQLKACINYIQSIAKGSQLYIIPREKDSIELSVSFNIGPTALAQGGLRLTLGSVNAKKEIGASLPSDAFPVSALEELNKQDPTSAIGLTFTNNILTLSLSEENPPLSEISCREAKDFPAEPWCAGARVRRNGNLSLYPDSNTVALSVFNEEINGEIFLPVMSETDQKEELLNMLKLLVLDKGWKCLAVDFLKASVDKILIELTGDEEVDREFPIGISKRSEPKPKAKTEDKIEPEFVIPDLKAFCQEKLPAKDKVKETAVPLPTVSKNEIVVEKLQSREKPLAQILKEIEDHSLAIVLLTTELRNATAEVK